MGSRQRREARQRRAVRWWNKIHRLWEDGERDVVREKIFQRELGQHYQPLIRGQMTYTTEDLQPEVPAMKRWRQRQLKARLAAQPIKPSS